MASKFRKLAFLSSLSLIIGTTSIKAQSLCPDIVAYTSTTRIGTLINFIDFDPAKLRLNESCDLSGQCSYSFIYRTENGFEQRYGDFTVTDFCNSISLSKERFQKLNSSASPSGSIASIHDFRAKTTLTVTGDGITLNFIRNDFNFEPEAIGWLATIDQDTDDEIVSAPLATSTFSVEIVWER